MAAFCNIQRHRTFQKKPVLDIKKKHLETNFLLIRIQNRAWFGGIWDHSENTAMIHVPSTACQHGNACRATRH